MSGNPAIMCSLPHTLKQNAPSSRSASMIVRLNLDSLCAMCCLPTMKKPGPEGKGRAIPPSRASNDGWWWEPTPLGMKFLARYSGPLCSRGSLTKLCTLLGLRALPPVPTRIRCRRCRSLRGHRRRRRASEPASSSWPAGERAPPLPLPRLRAEPHGSWPGWHRRPST